MRLLVVRCLALVVVRALMRALVKDGALCSTRAALSDLKWEKDSVCAFAAAR